jgi:hypothetical protein
MLKREIVLMVAEIKVGNINDYQIIRILHRPRGSFLVILTSSMSCCREKSVMYTSWPFAPCKNGGQPFQSLPARLIGIGPRPEHIHALVAHGN